MELQVFMFFCCRQGSLDCASTGNMKLHNKTCATRDFLSLPFISTDITIRLGALALNCYGLGLFLTLGYYVSVHA